MVCCIETAKKTQHNLVVSGLVCLSFALLCVFCFCLCVRCLFLGYVLGVLLSFFVYLLLGCWFCSLFVFVLFCLCCGVCFVCDVVVSAVVVGCCWSCLLYRNNETPQTTTCDCCCCFGLSALCYCECFAVSFFVLGFCVWGCPLLLRFCFVRYVLCCFVCVVVFVLFVLLLLVLLVLLVVVGLVCCTETATTKHKEHVVVGVACLFVALWVYSGFCVVSYPCVLCLGLCSCFVGV